MCVCVCVCVCACGGGGRVRECGCVVWHGQVPLIDVQNVEQQLPSID